MSEGGIGSGDRGDSDQGGSGRLPSGRHKLPREFVINSQRDRILDAIAPACEEKGYADVTVADVVERARVSRSTFYELFKDKETCFLAAYDAILVKFLADFRETVDTEGLTWSERVRAGVRHALTFFAAEPAFARMCIVDMLAAGPVAVERYLAAVRVITLYVDRGRVELPGRSQLPATLAPAIVGGAAEVIRQEILAGRTTRLTELIPDVLYMVLGPYLGQKEALREAAAAREELGAEL